MLRAIKSFGTVSRAEFLLPNLGSLFMGLAWGANPPLSLGSSAIVVVLAFVIINLSSAIGAQANTISDYQLDLKDARKRRLVETLDYIGRGKIRLILMSEFLVALILVFLFVTILGKPVLLVLWLAGISLGCAYSVQPVRFKSRSWLALASLILVLAILPTLFVYYSFTDMVDPLFIVSLVGLTLSVYGLIIPTEIRDYFGDRAMGIESMTVHLGLVKACVLSILLFSAGGALIAGGFLLRIIGGLHPVLAVFVLAAVAADVIVLRQYVRLYSLSKGYASWSNGGSTADQIVELSANNPKWIMLVTQTYTFLSIVLLVSKFVI